MIKIIDKLILVYILEDEKMTKKIIAIFISLLLTASVAASVAACGKKGNGSTETTGSIEVGTNVEGTSGNNGGNNTPSNPVGEIGDPGEYTYTECDQTVYVNNPDSEVTLRSADYVAMGSLKHGVELKRTGISTDEANYWSKVVYNGETYYMASKFITTMNNPDEGFVDISKTVEVNAKTGTLNIRNLPDVDNSSVIGHAVSGTPITVIAVNTETEWYKVKFVDANGQESVGYIRSLAKFFTEESANNNTTEAGTNAPAAEGGAGK
jgi:uncharacterized protein YgiM (DUF1202 family)